MQLQQKTFLKELITIIVLALVIVLPIRTFIAEPFVVSGESMQNSFHDGNYLIIDELSYDFTSPQRGQVIVFKAPPSALALENVATTSTVYYIKRVIGLPGETVQIDGDQVKIFNASSTNGFILYEPYAVASSTDNSPFENIHEKVTLGAGQYFAMGDNRHNSSDSRLWGILPAANIKGDVLTRLFPFTQIGLFPAEYHSYTYATSTASSTIK